MAYRVTRSEADQASIDSPVRMYRKIYELLFASPSEAIQEAERCIVTLSEAATPPNARVVFRLLSYCCEACSYLNSEKLLLSYVDRIKSLWPQISHTVDRVFYLQQIGACYYQAGLKIEAIKYLEAVMPLSEEYKLSDSEISQTLHLLGLVNFCSGQYIVALEYYHRLLRLVPESDTSLENCPLYCNLAEIYAALSQHSEAMKFFELGLASARAGGRPVVLSQMLTFLAEYYIKIRRQMDAARCIAESQELSVLNGFSYMRDLNVLLLARIRILNNDCDLALQMVEHLLFTAKTSNHQPLFKLMCTETLGQIYEVTGAHLRARDVFLRMADLAAQLGLQRELAEAYGHLSAIEEQRGAFAQALLFYKTSTSIWLGITGPAIQKQLADIARLRELQFENKLLDDDPNKTNFRLSRSAQKVAEDSRFQQVLRTLRQADHTNAMISESPGIASDGHSISNKAGIHLLSSDDNRMLALLKLNLLSRAPNLSQMETKICLLIARGLQSKEIADALSKSVETVNSHRKSIRKKLKLARGENLFRCLRAM